MMGVLPPAKLLFSDYRQPVYQRLLALRQRVCRGRTVALDQPLWSGSEGIKECDVMPCWILRFALVVARLLYDLIDVSE